ncbi:unnamed protein product [Dibothriocephalus latus]|uniref:Cyclin-dependent kinase 20 n=1 Tax=Dibothriocephalus latus TaxID=60516 RepID=A0A3P7LTB6_DIBLA|nr:unnamed protein product [Dibothriocephalus latus]
MGFVLVFDFMPTDLSEVLRNVERPLSVETVKSYMLMLLKGVAYMHANSIMHRVSHFPREHLLKDLKPANLLIDSKGILKIADFGLARVYSNENNRPYSHQVATRYTHLFHTPNLRWYRAPELLYGARNYSLSVDLWYFLVNFITTVRSVGAIFGELLNNSPLFPGENDIEQLWFVIRVLGTPTEEAWPGLRNLPDYNKISFTNCKPVAFEDVILEASPLAIDLLKKFLRYEPSERVTAEKVNSLEFSMVLLYKY